MRKSLPWLTSLFFIAGIVLTPADAPASAKIAVPNVFSYELPPGWVAVDLPGSSYPTAVEASAQGGKGQAKAMITINADSSPTNLTEWCSKSLARNQAQLAQLGAVIGNVQIFHTNIPAFSGMRAPIDLTARGRAIHYVLYFFAGSNNTKLAVTCACSSADAGRYEPIFESAMKTFLPY